MRREKGVPWDEREVSSSRHFAGTVLKFVVLVTVL